MMTPGNPLPLLFTITHTPYMGLNYMVLLPYMESILMKNLDFMVFGRQCKFHVPSPP